jgi:hypothetical protein
LIVACPRICTYGMSIPQTERPKFSTYPSSIPISDIAFLC